MSIIRMLYSPDSGIIFSKPRFILLPGEALGLVNRPTATPQEILTIFSNVHNWPLKQHEFYFQEADYRMSPLYASRLAAFAISHLTNQFSSRRKDYDFFADTSISRQLAERIIEAFRADVLEAQSRFVIVHLPTQKPLRDLFKERPLEYQDLLDKLASQYHLIDPASDLIHQVEVDSFDDLFAPESHHYSAIGNRVVAETIAAALLRTES
ncbi:MAG: SGNH/GDSL hydrolase family protein [Nitrospirales bacterium]|nr:SGNH/GDSL hydrolase family protein [Nitrospirales bacterium]